MSDDGFDPSRELKLTGMVIDQANLIELMMKKVIEAYVQPPKERSEFFSRHVLNNSIVPFAGKIRLIFAINNALSLVRLNKNAFHRLAAIRNAFAHNDVGSGLRVDAPLDPDMPLSTYVVVESIDGDGSIRTVSRDDAALEFHEAFDVAHKSLEEMLDKMGG